MSSISARKIPIPRIFAPSGPVSELALAIVLGLAITLGAVVARDQGMARYVVGSIGGVAFFLISMGGRLTGLRLIVVWLVFLGLTRRILIPFAGWNPSDPLLLVGPACAFMLWLNGREKSPAKRDGLTAFVVFFVFWVVAQVFNPLQKGTVLETATGIIFWLPPLIWFLVGRTFSLRDHAKIVNLIVILAIPVALHGQRQVFFGLFPFEYTWLEVSDFGGAVFVGGFNVRPFASLASPQEYGAFLSLAISLLWAQILGENKYRAIRIGIFALLGWALFLQGTRSIFAFLVISIAITSIMWARGVLKIAVAALLVGVLGFVSTLDCSSPEGGGAAGALAAHQCTGLLDPTGSGSTAGLHKRLILNGFDRAWKNPLGYGVTTATIVTLRVSGKKYNPLSTEADISDVFVSFGIPAGIAYLFFLMLVYVAAVRRVSRTHTVYGLGVLGVLIGAFGHIWTGGLYAVSSFIWLFIGGLTRPSEEELEEPEPEDAAPQPALLKA